MMPGSSRDSLGGPIAGDVLLAGAVGASLGHAAASLLFRPSAASLLSNAVDSATRARAFWLVAGAALAAAIAVALLHLVARRSEDATEAGARLHSRLRRLRPLALAWVVPLALDHELWTASPLLLAATSLVAIALAAHWLLEDRAVDWCALEPSPRVAATIVLVLATGFAAYVARHCVLNHHALGTRAYDLGIMENVFWNTAHGRWFASSLEGGSHLGVHTSFLYLALVPIYALAPRPETLLVLQAILVASAAWPLYLLARATTGCRGVGVVAATLYLLNPALQGAAFHDFHELAFAPPLFFAALLGLVTRRWRLLWVAAVLLLLVKEDQSIVVGLLGVFALLASRDAEDARPLRRHGVLLVAAGVVAYVVLQRLVIRHFASGEHDFAWYYVDMIPPGEGPLGLVRTIVVDPLHALRHVLAPERVLHGLRILAPVALLPLFRARGAVLVSYPLAMSLLASRAPLYELGWQYALLLVPAAFAGALVVVPELSRARRDEALLVAVGMTLLLTFHHGMVWPRTDFVGGGHRVTFAMSPGERQRYEQVRSVADHLGPDASVTASEAVVPHLARRTIVNTVRYLDRPGAREPDVFVLLGNDLDDATKASLPEVFDGTRYELAAQATYVAVYKRKARE